MLFIDNEKAYEYPFRKAMALSYIIYGMVIDNIVEKVIRYKLAKKKPPDRSLVPDRE